MVFLFLRRVSAAQLAIRPKDAASVEDADIAAVEELLQLVGDEDEEETYLPRSPRHTARSVTFEFEIKTEDEDEGSLSSFGHPSTRHDSYSPPPASASPAAPSTQLVVEVPTLTHEQRETYNGSPENNKVKRLSTSKAAPARRTTARRRTSAEVPVARQVATPRLSSARKPRAVPAAVPATTEEEESVRSGKRRKVSVEPEVEAAPAPTPRETRPRRSIRRTASLNTEDVSSSDAPAPKPKAATRGRASKLAPLVEEAPPATQQQRSSPRKPRV